MSDESQYVGREEVGADSYLGPTQYKYTCKCLRCEKTYSWLSKKLSEKDRPCPRKKCREAARREQYERERQNVDTMLEEQRTPGHVGSTGVRIIDATAELVQHDYGLTNLKDNIRTGDNMVPRLEPRMQSAADNFFSGPKHNTIGQQKMRRLGQLALAGAFRGNAINPGAVIPGKRGEPILRRVGTERLKG